MKKNILVQIGTRTETRTRLVPPVYDDNGEIITESYEETYEVEVPIMEAQNVEMTAEEIAEIESQELPEEPVDELTELWTQLADVTNALNILLSGRTEE